MLAEATLHGDASAQDSLESFCRLYRPPVMAFMRKRGVLESRVEDLAQDFFLQLMESSALKRADRGAGRFRSFICGALVKFLADDADRNRAQKRGGGVSPLSMDADSGIAGNVLADESEAAYVLDREWALHLVARALERVRQRWESLEKPERFMVLRAFLPGAMEIISQSEAAARLGLTDVAFRSELRRLREFFRAAVRAEIESTVAPGDVADEMRHLMKVFQSHPPSRAAEGKISCNNPPGFPDGSME